MDALKSDMLSSSFARPSRRVRTSLICAVVLLLLFVFLHKRSPAPPLPPMPGTYQYFHDVNFHSATKDFGAVSHCDLRFAPSEAPKVDEVRHSLTALLKSYVVTMNQLNVESWIAHGALIGWTRNRKLQPWDPDIDVQVSGESIALLAGSYNMTEYRFTAAAGETPRTYLLDINPHYSIVSEQDVANRIDGRWIDTSNGKFIDITAVHRSAANGGNDKSSVLFCKDGHRYKERDLYPLQHSTLEGIEVQVPFDAESVVREEYGKAALTSDHFHWYRYNRVLNIWEPE